MYKKIVVLAFVLAVALAPVSNTSAQSGAAVLFEDLTYAVIDDVPVPDWALVEGEGQFVYAEGSGTINCNGGAGCGGAGLDGQTVIIQQGFMVEIQGVQAGYFTASTAGRLQLPGEYPDIFFTGEGDGNIACSEGNCDLSMELDTLTEGGHQLTFSLIARLDIDHTSAGIVLQDFGGTAALAW